MIKPENYIVFDLETSGLCVSTDSIIEIGAVKVFNNKIIDKFSEICKFDGILDPVVTKVTGISDSDLKNAPNKVDVLNKFVKFLGNDVLIGHNLLKFDMPFLNYELVKNGMSKLNNSLLDTLQLSYKYAPRMKNHKLISLLNYYSIEYDTLHRALDDAIATQKLFEKMIFTYK